jgi:hypothetical protein
MRKRSQRDQATADTNYRSLSVRAATFNEENRSVEAVISTEQPVDMPDWGRQMMVPEVLVPSGAEFPSNRQVPFLDSHQRRSVKDQLGSAREIKINGNEITATLVFRKSKESDDALGGVRDGHITDVSVGYDVLKRQFIESGAKKTIGNRTYEGPVNVVTKWRLREVSLTPIGADDQAKLRGLDPAAVRFKSSEEQEEFAMNPELRALLVSKGMPEAHTDEQAQRWLIDNAAKLGEVKKEEKKEERSQQTQTLPTAADLAKLVADATRQAVADQAAARKAFEVDVRELCEMADMPAEIEACRELEDLAAVRKHIKDAKAKQAEHVPYGATVRHVSSGTERLEVDLRSALTLTACRAALNGDEAKLEKYYPSAQRSKQADNFRYATLFDMATEYVRSRGIQTLGLTRDQIAICAMFGPEKAGIRAAAGGAAYHGTGSFSNLTLDAVNKSMMIGYQEVPATWRGPMKQGQSATDFKNIHRMQLGAIPNLPVWNDSVRPDIASMADGKATYAVECRSIGIDFGYKLIVNDDMSALTSTPMKLGDAAARTVNTVAWAQITSNPTMRDAQSLFLETPTGLRYRKNLTTGTGAPSSTTLGTLKALMRLMRGENTPEGTESSDILNLTPAYLVVPASLETTAEVLVNSIYDPGSTGAGTFNPTRSLKLVVEPLLDAASTVAWYLFAEPTRVETVEVTFLAGQETPQVREVRDEHTLASTYYVLQSVAAKALDHRGIQKHKGEA